MTQLLEKNYGIAAVYGYSDDRHTLILRDEDGTELDLFSVSLKRRRQEVVEDWQYAHLLTWDMLNVEAQDFFQRDSEPDDQFAREEVKYTSVEGYVCHADLRDIYRNAVDEEVLQRWQADQPSRWDD